MPNWTEILSEITKGGGKQDLIRRKYLNKLANLTGRNVIVYYSGWLQKPTAPNVLLGINDSDKNGFMNAIYKLDVSKGLDLILHTPGGETAATESIVDYLRTKFNKDIRVVVPQLALSGGTMIACASKKIIMGKQSSLGPIDPQFGGISAAGVIEEFEKALKKVAANPGVAPIWQQIVHKYPISFVGDCEKAIKWSKNMTKEWLETGMFEGDSAAATKISGIIIGLGNSSTLSHSRHLSAKTCKDMGFGNKISLMEDDPRLQDAILSVHHAFMLTFEQTPAVKIIENNKGKAYVQSLQALVMQK